MLKKKKPTIVILSNANGGIATYQSNLINFCNARKIPSIIFDKTSINHQLKKIMTTKLNL